MIQSVEIVDLRGVGNGSLEGLAPLTVLVGRNGSGKSTILEALAIGAAAHPAELVGGVVKHRQEWNGAAYLVRARASEARVQLRFSAVEERTTALRFDERPAGLTLGELPPGHVPGPTAGPFTAVVVTVTHQRADTRSQFGERTVFDIGNEFKASFADGVRPPRDIRLVHPSGRNTQPMWRVLRDAVSSGRAEGVFELLRALLGPEFVDLYPLQESENGQQTNVHLRYRWGSVPVGVGGDGVRSLVRLALELAARPECTVLIEEPELHQHPGSLILTARAIWAAVARGAQVILTTHSLELLDSLLDQASPAELERLAVFRVAMAGGTLRSHRTRGALARDLRQQLTEDLR